jgi:hypothetical protein
MSVQRFKLTYFTNCPSDFFIVIAKASFIGIVFGINLKGISNVFGCNMILRTHVFSLTMVLVKMCISMT